MPRSRRPGRCLLLGALCLLASGCGLDAYYYLDEPLNDGHTAFYTSADEVQDYFSFVTNEESGENRQYFDSSAVFVFLGTEVYYKIYDNYSTMLSVESSVSSLGTSATSAAAENLVNVRGYKRLKLSAGTLTPLVEAGSSPRNRYVYIRLDDYEAGGSGYEAGICVGPSKMTSYSSASALRVPGGAAALPRRSIGQGYGFSFKRGDDANPVPQSGDEDYVHSATASEPGTWYVDMYAISVGRDNTYTLSYSRPLLLGSVAIRER